MVGEAQFADLVSRYADIFPLRYGMPRLDRVLGVKLIRGLVPSSELMDVIDGGVLLDLDTPLSERQLRQLGLEIIHARRQLPQMGGERPGHRNYIAMCPLTVEDWATGTDRFGSLAEAFSWIRGI